MLSKFSFGVFRIWCSIIYAAFYKPTEKNDFWGGKKWMLSTRRFKSSHGRAFENFVQNQSGKTRNRKATLPIFVRTNNRFSSPGKTSTLVIFATSFPNATHLPTASVMVVQPGLEIWFIIFLLCASLLLSIELSTECQQMKKDPRMKWGREERERGRESTRSCLWRKQWRITFFGNITALKSVFIVRNHNFTFSNRPLGCKLQFVNMTIGKKSFYCCCRVKRVPFFALNVQMTPFENDILRVVYKSNSLYQMLLNQKFKWKNVVKLNEIW